MVKIGLASAAVAAASGIELGSYPGYEGSLKVTGEVNAYLSRTGNAYVTYDLKGLEDACKTTPEGVGNACGIHIHEGKSCDDASAVGGHYYGVDSDPWGVLGYNSRYGKARGSVKAPIGQGQDISGRAIVVHDSTGGRVACALLPSKLEVATTSDPVVNIVELAESVPSLSTLVAAVVAGDLADTLSSAGPFTVFAPTNDAFGALPADTLDSLMKPENKATLVDILLYHVLAGEVQSKHLKSTQTVTTVEGKALQIMKDRHGGVTVSPDGKDIKQVTAADNLATNGVAHIIDGVLLPSLVPTVPNIVELAESVPSLSTLVAAVVAGDLADTLSSPGPFTVFAPTNDAFGALPAGTLDSLMKPENKETLVDILLYHVLPAKVLSTDLDLFQAVTTVEGKPLHVQKWGGVVQVGPSLASTDLKKVIAADNLAINGVVHIVDGVLLPPAKSVMV